MEVSVYCVKSLVSSYTIKSEYMRKKIEFLSQQSFKVIAAVTLVSLLSISKGQAQEIKGSTVVATVTETATVISVNQKTREVVIKTEDGQEHSFVAGDHVKNLKQVKAGDIITAKYTEAVAYQLKKHGEAAGVQSTQGIASAPPGSKPAGAIAQQTTVTVTITAIDPTIPTVTFKGPKGNTETIKVKDPQKLVGVKVGDMVDLTYTEALAITVDEAPKK
jgi:hypothetical protein